MLTHVLDYVRQQDKTTAGRQAHHLFLGGECLQIRYFSGTKPWTEERAEQVWKEEFGGLPSRKTEEAVS